MDTDKFGATLSALRLHLITPKKRPQTVWGGKSMYQIQAHAVDRSTHLAQRKDTCQILSMILPLRRLLFGPHCRNLGAVIPDLTAGLFHGCGWRIGWGGAKRSQQKDEVFGEIYEIPSSSWVILMMDDSQIETKTPQIRWQIDKSWNWFRQHRLINTKD